VVLYELLTLEQPFEGPSKEATFQRILRGDPTPLRKLNPQVPQDLAAVCAKAMAFEPDLRYATAQDMADDLRNVRTLRPTTVKPASHVGVIWRRARRNPWTTGAVAVGVVLFVVAGWWWKRTRDVRETLAYHEAFERVVKATYHGASPLPEDLLLLSKLFPDAASMRSFQRNPGDPKSWDAISMLLADLPRSRASAHRLLFPRATIAELRPTFEFEVPKAGSDTLFYRLTLSSDGRPDLSFDIVQPPGEARTVLFSLPPETPLEAGHSYLWEVMIDPERPQEFVEFKPDPAEFTVADPALKDAFLVVTGTRDEVADRLLNASAMNAHGLARESLALLDERAFAEATEEERALRDFLAAEALALLGDSTGFGELYGRFLARTKRVSEEAAGNG